MPQGFKSLVTPVFLGSTTVFESVAEVKDDWRVDAGYAYGLYGTPTTRELAARIADLGQALQRAGLAAPY